MKTCRICWWRDNCSTANHPLMRPERCHTWYPRRRTPQPIVGIALACLLGTLMWAALIYALPLLILAAKGFGQ